MDMHSRKSARDCCRDLYERLCDPSFNLYLSFLNFYLPMLGEVHELCEEENINILPAYKKILSMKKFLAEAIVFDVDKPDDLLLRDDNLWPVDEERYDQDHEADENDDEDDNGISFPSGEFSDIWKQTVEHDLLTSRQRQSFLENCARFLHRLIQNPRQRKILQPISLLLLTGLTMGSWMVSW
ncbi:uncharacterized protein LOC134187321 [Corticium candelabrum]|uniref:uncharacterized protein LOC134187321 n=1 Tax=Corticium candelabrum TaxID=121492 RepID=UPI002E26FB78|nr:uncharacterized protein LOC134187321 [Corticium candelabrum]